MTLSKIQLWWQHKRHVSVPADQVLVLLLILQWVGWIPLSEHVAIHMQRYLFVPPLDGLAPWASVPIEFKFAVLLHYLLVLVGALVAWICALQAFLRPGPTAKRWSLTVPWLVPLAIFFSAVNIALWQSHVQIGQTELWFLASIGLMTRVEAIPQVRLALRWNGRFVPALVCFIVYLGVLAPIYSDSLVLKNDYLEIPETTILDSGEHVDNLQWINGHRTEGLQIYDYRTGQTTSEAVRESYSVQLSPGTLVQTVIARQPAKFSYDKSEGRLYVDGAVTEEELNAMVPLSTGEGDIDAINQLYASSNRAESARNLHLLSADELSFLQKNRLELNAQMQLGRFFYHHQYYFSAILARSLAINMHRVSVLYGVGSTIVFEKVLELTGGVTFDHYFSVFYSIYLVYAVLLVIFSYLILGSWRFMSLIFVGAMLMITLPGYDDFLQAPGFNPVRHLFDIVTFYVLFRYALKAAVLDGILLAVLVGISIWWSREFGIFAFIAVLMTLVFVAVTRANVRLRTCLVLTAVVVAGVAANSYLRGASAPDLLGRYALVGISMPNTDERALDLLLILGGLALLSMTVAIAKRRNRMQIEDSALLAVLIALTVYLSIAFVYVIWYPSPHHLAPLAPALTLLFAVTIKLLCRLYDISVDRYSIFTTISALVFLTALVPLAGFFLSYSDYHRLMANHVVHRWDLKMAHIQSTMDPVPFAAAVSQIRKYAPGNEIVLISKYGHLLPSLAAKFNAVGLPELESTLVTGREVRIAIDAIDAVHPKYLFVDTTIDVSGNDEILDPKGNLSQMDGLYAPSLGRVLALSTMRLVFDGVKENYTLIDRGDLISVFERK